MKKKRITGYIFAGFFLGTLLVMSCGALGGSDINSGGGDITITTVDSNVGAAGQGGTINAGPSYSDQSPGHEAYVDDDYCSVGGCHSGDNHISIPVNTGCDACHSADTSVL